MNNIFVAKKGFISKTMPFQLYKGTTYFKHYGAPNIIWKLNDYDPTAFCFFLNNLLKNSLYALISNNAESTVAL